MGVSNLFKTTVSATSPLDGSTSAATIAALKKGGEEGADQKVSDFLTVQSLANFGAVTGGVNMAWNGLSTLKPEWFAGIGTPFGMAFLWLVASLAMSHDQFYKDNKIQWSTLVGGLFVGFINALVLASAVLGAAAGAKNVVSAVAGGSLG